MGRPLRDCPLCEGTGYKGQAGAPIDPCDCCGTITDAEREVLSATAEAWNTFLTLPVEHPDDLAEFRHALHALQRIVLTRPTRRALAFELRS